MLASVMALTVGLHTFTRGDATLSYRVLGAGNGPVLVMLAGGPGFSTSYLRAAAEHFAQNNTVVLLDQRGTGASVVKNYDARTISIAQNVADLEALRVLLHQDRLRLWGHSWGAMLTMLYATRYPNRVAALVLSDSGGPDMTFADDFNQRVHDRTAPADREAMEHWKPLREGPDGQRASLEYFRAQLGAYVDVRDAIPLVVDEADPHGFDTRVSKLMFEDLDEHYDVKPGLGALKNVPVLIVLGRDDPIGPGTATAIADLIEGSKLEYVDGAAHFPWAEQPAAYYRVVDAFLHG